MTYEAEVSNRPGGRTGSQVQKSRHHNRIKGTECYDKRKRMAKESTKLMLHSYGIDSEVRRDFNVHIIQMVV